MAKNIVTQERLKEVLHYCPDSGSFTWLATLGNRSVAGTICAHTVNRKQVRIRIDGVYYLAHRLAFLYMTGVIPTHEVDHINHNPSDNRWVNLRAVNHKTNGRNQRKPKNNTSGITGVSRRSDGQAWTAKIMVNGKDIYLGSFKDIEEAKIARASAQREYGFHENHGV